MQLGPVSPAAETLAPTPRWHSDNSRISWIQDLRTDIREACWDYLTGITAGRPTLPLDGAVFEDLQEVCLIDGRAYGVIRMHGIRHLIHAVTPDVLRAGPVGQITFPPYDALEALSDATFPLFADAAGLTRLRDMYPSNPTSQTILSDSVECTVCGSGNPSLAVGEVAHCTNCGTLMRPPGSTDWDRIYADPEGGYFRTIHAQDCRSMAGHGYEDYEEWARVILGRAHFDNRVRWIESVTGESQVDCLDVGCATGQMVAAFARRSWRAAGTDLSTYCVSRATELYPQGRFTAGGIEDYSGRPVRVVTYLDVFEHLVDPVAELKVIRQVLASDGWLFLELPNQSSADADVLGSDYMFKEHIFYYGPQQIRRLLNSNGFTVAAVTTAHDTYFRIDRLVGPEAADQLLASQRGERLLVLARKR